MKAKINRARGNNGRQRSFAGAFLAGLLAGMSSFSATSGVTIDNKPLTVANAVPNNLVLTPSVEWPTVVTHANDPGVGDTSSNYSTNKAYSGYFNTELCYAYHFDAVERNRYFYPVKAASSRACSGTGGDVPQGLWSGNFLNWASMQAIDTFRMALTGGYRVHRPADGTPPSVTVIGSSGTAITASTSEMPNVTYLEKGNSDRQTDTYVPKRRLTSDGAVRGATPVQTANNRGINTRIGGLRNQLWLYPKSDGYLGSSQLLRPVTDGVQIAGDVEAIPYNPAFHKFPNSPTSTVQNSTPCAKDELGCTQKGKNNYEHTIYGNDRVYAVSIRVKVCDGALDIRDFCRPYGTHYKPEGLLQENAKKFRYSVFAYLTESGNSRKGGVMRARQKLIGPVTDAEQAGDFKPYPDRIGRIPGIDNPEWDPKTGVFLDNPDSEDAAATSLAIGTCNNAPDGSNCQIRYSGVINYLNRFGQIETGNQSLKSYDNVGEMYYTMLRYLRGIGNIPAYSNLTGGALANYQNADGLPVITDWYKNGASKVAWTNGASVGSIGDPMLYQCQGTVALGIGDTGSHQDTRAPESDPTLGDYTTFMSTWLNNAWNEGANTSRNLISALAYWAHVTDMRSDIPNTLISNSPERRRGQSLSTYWVDVVELKDLKSKTTNQYYLATKYGGYRIPDDSYDANGNAAKPLVTWLDANRNLWSSATELVKAATGLGGTGDFYLPDNMFLANDGAKMIQSLKAAFQRINDAVTGSGGSFASNATRLETGAYTYQAKFTSSNWGGHLVASSVDPSTGALTQQWDAATWLTPTVANEYTKRKIFYNNGGTLKNFISNWNNYTVLTSPTISTPAGLSSITDAQLKYLLGDNSGERKFGGAFRDRSSMLGDIINSQPVYVGLPNVSLYKDDPSYASFVQAQSSRTPVVYVGANDGMLHAFDASTGSTKGRELFAFMPTAAMSVLTQSDPASNKYPIWSPDYDHAYSVDGELTVADVKINGAWQTVLVGSMGRGGKSIFALNITDPNNPKLLWEKTSADIGNILGKPIIAKTAAGWKVYFGNGPNSTNGGSKLISLNVADGSELTAISAGSGTDNGMGPVNVWDDDDDGVFDTAYAGDMNGDLYKFDLANGTSMKLFAAASAGQPITVQPLVARNPYSPGQTWVFFGTGRYLSLVDTTTAANQIVQSWYGLVDSNTLINGKSELEEVKIIAEDNIGRVIENNPSLDPGKKGWYIDLKVNGGAAKGERMVVPNFFQGLVLIGTTRYPESSDPCSPGGRGYTMAINPFTGGRLPNAFFDNDGSGKVGDAGDSSNGSPYSGIGYNSGPNNPIFISDIMYTSMDDGSSKITKTSSSEGTVRRVSWRELLNGG